MWQPTVGDKIYFYEADSDKIEETVVTRVKTEEGMRLLKVEMFQGWCYSHNFFPATPKAQEELTALMQLYAQKRALQDQISAAHYQLANKAARGEL